MRSTWHGLETAKRALFANQAALNTTGHNIANASTPGYSRQRANFETTASLEYPGLTRSVEAGQLGTGVVVESIERIREGFLDLQYRNENRTSGEWEIRQDSLDKLQAIMNEPSDTGLSKVLNNFFLSWQTLGRNKDMPARNTVKQATLDLVESFQRMDAKLVELDKDIGESVGDKVTEFNSLTGQIVDLNKQINQLEVLGDNANDLRDRRDYLTDQLSKIGGISARELPNGTYTISLGTTVIVNGTAPAVQLSYDAATNATNLPVASGEIGGLIASRTEYVNVYRDQLDSLVNGLVNGKIQSTLPNDYTLDSSVTALPYDVRLPNGTVLNAGDAVPAGGVLPKGSQITFNGLNELHSFGFTAKKPTDQAGPLFETSDGSTVFNARNIRLAKAIIDDVQNIASSNATYIDPGTGDTYVKEGNGDAAFMIGEAVTAVIDFKDGLPPNGAILARGTVADYLRASVGQLGLQAQTAERQVENQDALLRQIDNRRMSVSGVSLDEEMSNMIKFQQSYAAAARVVSTLDTLLDTIINRMAAH